MIVAAKNNWHCVGSYLHSAFCFHTQVIHKTKGVTKMENKRFLDVNDVAEYMSISTSKAYKIIRALNNELKAKGYIVIAGKINRTYFEEKIYGIAV